jgi:hypothetical protein
MVARDLIKRNVGGAIVNISTVVLDRFSGFSAPYGKSRFSFVRNHTPR